MTATQAQPDHDEIGYNGDCNALKRQAAVEGERCSLPAGWGTTHVGVGACKLHGGSTRNHVRFAQVVEAEAYVNLFGGRKDVTPGDALLELVQTKAREVEYWRYRVSLLAEEDLTWGTTREKQGGEDYGTTQEAKPAAALQLLHEAERDLAAYSSAALKAGVAAERLRFAQAAAQVVVAALTRALDRLELTDAQQSLAVQVVPEVLRSLEPAGEQV